MAGKKYALSVVVEAVDRATAPLTAIQKSLNKTFKPFRQLGQSLNTFTKATGIPKLAASLGDVGRAADDTTRKLGKLALWGAGLGYAFKKGFLDVAASFESYRTTLNVLEGSSAKAEKSMAWVSKFAATTPYNIKEVMNSFVLLRAYGLDPTNGSMRALGDASAALQKPLDMAINAMADAVTGENERLKEFGINTKKVGDTILYYYTLNGKQMVAKAKKNNRQMIESTLSAIFNAQYAGMMDKQSKTWNGMLSNIGDQWTRFADMVMRFGPFDFLKEKLSGFLALLDRMAASGELEKLARQVGTDMVQAFKTMWSVAKDLVSVLKGMWSVAQFLHDIFGSWKPLIIALSVVIAGPLIASLVALGSALATVGGIMIATGITPVVLAIAAAVAGLTLALKAMGLTWYDVFYNIGKWITWVVDKLIAAVKWMGKVSMAGSRGGGGRVTPSTSPVSELGSVGGYRYAPAINTDVTSGLARNTTSTNKVIVDFQNVPKGTRVQTDSGLSNGSSLDMNLGYAMGGR